MAQMTKIGIDSGNQLLILRNMCKNIVILGIFLIVWPDLKILSHKMAGMIICVCLVQGSKIRKVC